MNEKFRHPYIPAFSRLRFLSRNIRQIILSAIPLLLLILFIVACKKDSYRNPEPPIVEGNPMDEIDYSISGDGSHLVVSYMRSSKALEYLNDNLYDHLTHIIILAEHTSYEVKDDGHILASEALIEIFKPEGLLLTQAIIWYNIGHMKAAEPYLDYINVMIYDNFEANNYHSSYAQFMDFVDNILDKGLPKEKLLAGLPFYGYFALSDWSLKGGTAYSFILEQYNPKIGVDLTFRADGVALSFDGVVKIWKKCAYTLEKDLAGVMMWETWMDIPNFESDSSLMYHVNSVFPVEN